MSYTRKLAKAFDGEVIESVSSIMQPGSPESKEFSLTQDQCDAVNKILYFIFIESNFVCELPNIIKCKNKDFYAERFLEVMWQASALKIPFFLFRSNASSWKITSHEALLEGLLLALNKIIMPFYQRKESGDAMLLDLKKNFEILAGDKVEIASLTGQDDFFVLDEKTLSRNEDRAITSLINRHLINPESSKIHDRKRFFFSASSQRDQIFFSCKEDNPPRMTTRAERDEISKVKESLFPAMFEEQAELKKMIRFVVPDQLEEKIPLSVINVKKASDFCFDMTLFFHRRIKENVEKLTADDVKNIYENLLVFSLRRSLAGMDVDPNKILVELTDKQSPVKNISVPVLNLIVGYLMGYEAIMKDIEIEAAALRPRI